MIDIVKNELRRCNYTQYLYWSLLLDKGDEEFLNGFKSNLNRILRDKLFNINIIKEHRDEFLKLGIAYNTSLNNGIIILDNYNGDIINIYNSILHICGHSDVFVDDNKTYVYDNSFVRFSSNNYCFAYDNSRICAFSGTIICRNNSYVDAYNKTMVIAYQDCTIRMHDHSYARVVDNGVNWRVMDCAIVWDGQIHIPKSPIGDEL